MKLPVATLLLLSTQLFAQQSSPLVVAHRGACGYLPEHTLPAKALAYGMGADFLEQDVVLTKDNVPIVSHDIHLDTVTDVALRFPDRHRADGRYYALDFTLAEIQQLSVHERMNLKSGRPEFINRFPVGASKFQISTLEEEIQFVQGLNKSTGRAVGIYPELKQPKWHSEQGRDLSRSVLPILEKYGYANKDALCWIQCFELAEIQRLRHELKWEGKLLLLLGSGPKDSNGNDTQRACTAAGLEELSHLINGIGPAINSIIAGNSKETRHITDLVTLAHQYKIAVHPYTMRRDELPKTVESTDDLHQLLFEGAKVDGIFTDFPDLSVKWLNHFSKGNRIQ